MILCIYVFISTSGFMILLGIWNSFLPILGKFIPDSTTTIPLKRRKKLIVSLNHSFLIIRLYLYGVVINPQRRQWPWWYVNDKAKIINVLITANRSFIAT